MISGGLGNDTFKFDFGWGMDTVSDFNANNTTDLIDFSSLGLSGFGDLTVQDQGADVLIHVTGDVANTITLENVDHTTIDAGDFMF